jgi:AcrR family transcriptional regulator
MPIMSDEKRNQVKEHIELGAIRCFVRKGFHGTTTREIAREAGVSTGGLYGHYQGKEELFASVIERYKRLFSEPDNPLLAYFESNNFPDDIPELGKAIEGVINQHRDFWLLWYVDVLEFQGRHFAGSFLDAGPSHPALDARFTELDGGGRLRMPASLAFYVVYMHLFNHLIVQILFSGRESSELDSSLVLSTIEDIALRGILAE